MTFPTGSTPHGVSVAFGADALAASPTWSYIDGVVQRWTIRRGRSYMTDRTETGTAQADFADTTGALDPTNSTGEFYPMDPNCPFAIGLKNPTAAGSTAIPLFRGMVQQIPTTVDVSEKYSSGSIMADDLFSLLSINEIPPGLDYDATADGTSTANAIGDTTYAATDVQSRIKAVLADAGVPAGLTDIFTGNVDVVGTVETQGTSQLAMIWDAADAEFPNVANVFVGKDGIVNFRGRLSRFNPTDPTYNINTWNVGDVTAVAGDSSFALIKEITFDRDVAKIINAAKLTPQDIADADIPGMEVTDTGSITQYGRRALSGTDLITADDNIGNTTPEDAVKVFNAFFVDNYHDAQTRVTQLVFTNVPLHAANASAHWAFLCGVEISDVVNVTTHHPGGGGFNAEPYFVEGITYEAEPMGQVDADGDPVPHITMTLDLSPGAYYTTDPFA